MADKLVGDIKTKISADASGVKKEMGEANAKIHTSKLKMELAASAAKAFGSAQDELKAKQRGLSGVLDEQKSKLKVLAARLQETKNKTGPTSEATRALTNDLMSAKISVNKTQAELKKVNTELQKNAAKAAAAASSWDGLKKKLAGAGKVLSSVARAAAVGVGAVGGAVVTLGAGIFGMAVKTANTADELVDLSAKTGISVERLQELAYIGGQVGTDVDTVSSSLAKFTRSMGNADKTEEVNQAFKQLGVAVTDSSGKLRDSETVFFEALDALGQMTDETERDVLAMTLFGKSAMELNPLIKTDAKEMRRLANEARYMGAVMSEEDVKASAALADQLYGLKRSFSGVTGTLLSTLMPGLNVLADKGGSYLKQFSEVIQDSDGDFGKMSEGMGKLAGSLVQEITSALPGLMQAGMAILQGILTGIIANLPMLVSSAVEIILSLVDFLIANLPMLLDAAVQIILALVTGLTEALPTLIPAMVQAIMTMIQGLIENLPLLVEAAKGLILALIEGIMAAIPELINALPGVATALVETLQEVVPEMVTIGGHILMGVLDGILGMKDKFSADVMNFFKGIVTTVKEALGIHSPSRPMKPLGRDTVRGFVVGMKDTAKKMQAEVNASMRGLALGGAAAGADAVNESYTFYGPVSLGGAAGQRVSEQAKAKRW